MGSAHLEYDQGIFAIDANYIRPQLAAIHFIIEKGHAVIIDTGTNSSVEPILSALQALGIPPDKVDGIILTHVHLDHAGGAGSLIQKCPEAKLLVHPRGRRHMVLPDQLIAGAQAVYGKEPYTQIYGTILPVAPDRVIEANEGLKWNFQERWLHFIDTPGHARHHICVFDEKSQTIFTGDTFGLAYRELRIHDRAFIFPSTSPVQFEPQALKHSIKRILSFQPQAAYLTHYAQVQYLPELAQHLLELIDLFVDLSKQAPQNSSQRQAWLESQLLATLYARYFSLGGTLSETEVNEIIGVDVTLNAQGLLAWWDKIQG